MAPTLSRRSRTLNGPSVSCGLFILVGKGCLVSLEHLSGGLLKEYPSYDRHLLLRRSSEDEQGWVSSPA